MINVELASGVTACSEHDVRMLHEQVQHLGVPVFVLETGVPADRHTFFAAVRSAFPLDPPVISSRSWDAFSDSLWEGIETLGASQVVILWPDAHQMKSGAPDDYETAIAVLDDVAHSLQGISNTARHSIELCVYVSSAEAAT